MKTNSLHSLQMLALSMRHILISLMIFIWLPVLLSYEASLIFKRLNPYMSKPRPSNSAQKSRHSLSKPLAHLFNQNVFLNEV